MAIFIDNAYKVQFAKTQFYGQANGNMLIYPAQNICLDGFDPRLR